MKFIVNPEVEDPMPRVREKLKCIQAQNEDTKTSFVLNLEGLNFFAEDNEEDRKPFDLKNDMLYEETMIGDLNHLSHWAIAPHEMEH